MGQRLRSYFAQLGLQLILVLIIRSSTCVRHDAHNISYNFSRTRSNMRYTCEPNRYVTHAFYTPLETFGGRIITTRELVTTFARQNRLLVLSYSFYYYAEAVGGNRSY